MAFHKNRSELLNQISTAYTTDGYNVEGVECEFPSEEMVRWTADIILEDRYSQNYKVVEVSRADQLDASVIRSKINDNERQAHLAAAYFEDSLDAREILAEAVIATSGDLAAVDQISSHTYGVFTWEEALETISGSEISTGRLGNLKDNNTIVLDHDMSRKSRKEIYRFSDDLDELTTLLQQANTYP